MNSRVALKKLLQVFSRRRCLCDLATSWKAAQPDSVARCCGPPSIRKQFSLSNHQLRNAVAFFPEDVRTSGTFAIFHRVLQTLVAIASAVTLMNLWFFQHDQNTAFCAVEKDDAEHGAEKPKRKFHDLKMLEYENRIRAYSSAEKIFRYFATLRLCPSSDQTSADSCEVFMRMDDFFRSITPGTLQPEGLGLEQYNTIYVDETPEVMRPSEQSEDVFAQLGPHGLISFEDFVFLLTVLTASPRRFTIMFKMFDVNNDGQLDYSEFEKVQKIVRSQSSLANCKRRHFSLVGKEVHSSLLVHLFGSHLDKKLSLRRFLAFRERLQCIVLKEQFLRYASADGQSASFETLIISDVAFAKMLLMHSRLSKMKRRQMIGRVKKLCAQKPVYAAPGFGFREVLAFFEFLNELDDVETALHFYHLAGAAVDQVSFRHIVHSIASKPLSDHMIDVIFCLFDKDQDGKLSYKEFVKVMKRRFKFGFGKDRDLGVFRILSEIFSRLYDKVQMVVIKAGEQVRLLY